MLATTLSGVFFGVDAYIVQVEVDISDGFSAFSTVGLLDSAIKKEQRSGNSGHQEFKLPFSN